MRRTIPGTRAGWCVEWTSRDDSRNGGRSRPCLMCWAAEVRARLIRRGHRARMVPA